MKSVCFGSLLEAHAMPIVRPFTSTQMSDGICPPKLQNNFQFIKSAFTCPQAAVMGILCEILISP